MDLKTIVSLCKRRGFIFPGSDIYGGLANTWDYGPYGVELKNNLKKAWWKFFVESRDDIVGIDASILMNQKVWEASGHVSSFTDPLVDCKKCKERFRGDKLLEDKIGVEKVAGKSNKEIGKMLLDEKINCPNCGASPDNYTEPKQFNLMFKTHQGVTEDSETLVYMRPETAQGIFVNFKNVVQTARKRVPFGIAQIGKAFRNEITPGNFTFRTREFEQMEIEYFCKPDDWKEIYENLEKDSWDFMSKILGINEKSLRWREHEKDELSHYSDLTKDIEYKFPWGWGELEGLAYRACFDLSQHQEFSGENMEYTDPQTQEKYIPHVVEPSFGCDRTVLVTLLDAYYEEEVKGEKRVVMKFKNDLAPVKVAVLPLSKKEELSGKSRSVFEKVKAKWASEYDETGSIGKRYRRQDEIGTPLCVTIDFDTLEDDQVTIRERDSMDQVRIKIENLEQEIEKKLKQ